MIGFKSLAISLFTLASVVSATFEPLDVRDVSDSYSVADIYRRNQFSSNRHYLRSTKPDLSPEVSGYLVDLQANIGDFKSSISSVCKKGFKGQSTTKISNTLTPIFEGCKKKVHTCGQKIKGCQPGGGPKPSKTPKPPSGPGGGAGGCSGQLADVISEIIAAIKLIEQEIKTLKNAAVTALLEIFLIELNLELVELLSEANNAVPGVQAKTSTFLSSFDKELKAYGITL